MLLRVHAETDCFEVKPNGNQAFKEFHYVDTDYIPEIIATMANRATIEN